MYLADAKKLLNDEYHKWYDLSEKKFQRDVMDEKIKHSYQVLGAGNFILNHESCFADCSAEGKEYLQAMLLLHDVARFYEFIEKGEGRHLDHGVQGAKMLSEIPQFSAVEFCLPIRHHGHLIEALYEDEEYNKLSQEMQKKVKRNTFLVRDADKLAIFYLLATNFESVRDAFFSPVFFSPKDHANLYDKKPCFAMLKEYNEHNHSISTSIRTNYADKALLICAWIYDLNYSASFEFMKRLRIVPKLFENFSRYWNPEDKLKFKQTMEEYIENRF